MPTTQLKPIFEITVRVDKPIVVGQDNHNGRRQLIPILSGELVGDDLHGIVLPGGVDSQIIRPDGCCELSARYGILMDDGSSFYVENNGIRTVPEEYVEAVKAGEFIDSDLYYFATKPDFEVFGENLNWLKQKLFICQAKRFPDKVLIEFYVVE